MEFQQNFDEEKVGAKIAFEREVPKKNFP